MERQERNDYMVFEIDPKLWTCRVHCLYDLTCQELEGILDDIRILELGVIWIKATKNNFKLIKLAQYKMISYRKFIEKDFID